VGFLAAARADVPRAEAIFGALERVRPERGFAYAGLAVCYMNAGRGDDAVRVLERGTARVPATEFAELEAFRALALQLAGRTSESLRAAESAGSAPLALAMRGQGTIPTEES
jgi:thioredoxin-like negative regulator of GroEL